MCFQFCSLPNLEKIRQSLPTRVTFNANLMQLWVKNKSLTFTMINSIFHRGGEVCAWEQTKFDLIIEFQLLTKFSIHSSTASWLNWIIDLRRGGGEHTILSRSSNISSLADKDGLSMHSSSGYTNNLSEICSEKSWEKPWHSKLLAKRGKAGNKVKKLLRSP